MNDYFSLNLGEREFHELNTRGYLKIKVELSRKNIGDLEEAFAAKKEFVFRFKDSQIKTILTSIDVAKETESDVSKVFLGFAPI
jgi:hypothetical protein